MASPFDFLTSINQTKEDITKDDPSVIKDYSPFIINKGLSYFLDTVMYANEINSLSCLDKDMQYKFYLTAINKSKRFSKWSKQEISDDIELIKRVYRVNNKKALEIIKILSAEQINKIKNEQLKGGMSK